VTRTRATDMGPGLSGDSNKFVCLIMYGMFVVVISLLDSSLIVVHIQGNKAFPRL
jgi:hypothetical protein